MSISANEQVIAESIDYLVAHYQDAPSLDDLARRAGYDKTHFQKLFKDKVGISPKRLCQYMHMSSARDLLYRGENTLFAAQESGLSGNARLHDLFVACEGVTPGDIQKRGKGLTIAYGVVPSILGRVMIAKTPLGVCWLGFMVEESEQESLGRIQSHWPHATVIRDGGSIRAEADHLMRVWDGSIEGEDKSNPLKLDLYGTNFQIQVWQALLKIPNGETLTYQDIARDMGRPKSSRAVGNAVGANPISLLIPCHRVIRATGIIDNYGWGSPRKKLILATEQNLVFGRESTV
jgi:AraC family transcriptional regulator of adaptative response/methylated-DNA-[protein]-cysteine methyltransferase